jgi:hypothetical protein
MVPSEMLLESIDANAAFSIRLISGKPLKQPTSRDPNRGLRLNGESLWGKCIWALDR